MQKNDMRPTALIVAASALTALQGCSGGGNSSQPEPTTAPLGAPIAVIQSDTLLSERSSLEISGEGSYDPGGSSLQYLWTVNPTLDGAVTVASSESMATQLSAGEIASDAVVGLTLRVTNEAGEQGSATVDLSVEEIDADLLPPDPGSAGKVDLLGIDVDGDRVRDDIAHAIYDRYPLDFAKRETLSVAAVSMQGQLAAVGEHAVNDQAVVQAQRQVSTAVACIFYGGFESAQLELGWLESMMGNTPQRAETFLQYQVLLGGTVTEVAQIAPENCQHSPAR